MEKVSKAVREQSRRNTLAGKNLEDGLWIFGYGSLMWDPGFSYVEKQQGELPGYHRSFCVWATFSRGTPESPGLSLGLKSGGKTQGFLFKIAPEDVQEVTLQMWEREIQSGVLKPEWCMVKAASGQVQSLVFVVDPTHPSYADLDNATAAPFIVRAKGKKGTCLDYLLSTMDQLRQLNIVEPELEDLMAHVNVHRSQ